MAKDAKPKYTNIPIKDLETPKAGVHDIIIDAWWIVTPEDEILLYQGRSPQYNQNKTIAERVIKKLHPPEYTLRQIPIIFLPFNDY